MSLQAGLVTEITTLMPDVMAIIGDRVFPLVMPQRKQGEEPVVPCIVYEVPDVARQVTYCGTNGLTKTLIRLDCYSPSYDDTIDLAKKLFLALRDFRGALGGIVDVRAASLETEFDVQDIEPGLYRRSQSWTFWHFEEE